MYNAYSRGSFGHLPLFQHVQVLKASCTIFKSTNEFLHLSNSLKFLRRDFKAWSGT
uniref:Uncharacterized protein n=1 Tax=Helianthus annuus TaxID=4232 RepID=A0A251UBA7_HELAN